MKKLISIIIIIAVSFISIDIAVCGLIVYRHLFGGVDNEK